MSTTQAGEKKKLAVIQILLGCTFWSFAGLLSQFVPWNTFSLAGIRAFVATLILGATRKSFRIVNTRGTWLGAMGVCTTSILFMLANKLASNVANAIVLQYAMPVCVILYTAVFLKVRPKKLDVVTCVVTLSGVVLCFFQAFESGGMFGNVLALMSAFTYSIVFLAAKREDCDALSYSFMGTMLTSLCMVAIPFDKSFTFELAHWVPAIGMGVCLAGGYYFFSAGMRKNVSPVTAAIVANVEPVLSPTWCFIFLGDNPGVYTIVGALIVLGSVTCYSILSTKKPAEQEAA